MQNRFVALVIVAVAMAAVASSVSPPVAAQAPAYEPGRTVDGHPDLQGVWRVWNLAKYDLEAHGAKPGVPAGLGFVVDPADGRIPYQPWALEQRQRNYEHTRSADLVENADPLAKCYIPGIPRLTYLGWPFRSSRKTNGCTSRTSGATRSASSRPPTSGHGRIRILA